MIPFEISFKDTPESDFVFNAIEKRIEKLAHFFSDIIRCEVVVSCPHKHRHSGQLFHVLIHLFLPVKHVIINRHTPYNEAHRDVYVAIRDAFDAADRVLEDKVRVMRQKKVKFHTPDHEQGVIAKIFFDRGYGFITTPDEREIYFSENAILNAEFERVHVGDHVKFVEEPGEKGPQVTSMSIVKRRSEPSL